MDLLQNPFHLLGASPRDDRRRIVELAEERSLSLDPALCSQARATLTNPRNRLAAEVAWLPGLGPEWNGETVQEALRSPWRIHSLQGAPALPKANLLAAALPNVTKTDALISDIKELTELHERCDAEEVRVLVNRERALAGFPEVHETSLVEEALAERRGYYRAALRRALDAMPPLVLVGFTTRLVTELTAQGRRPAPALIVDLVSTYEVEAQHFLETEARNVELLVKAARRTLSQKLSPELLDRLLTRLGKVVMNWDRVAQPIQLIAMSRGQDHALSERVAGLVRSLSLELYNEHGSLDAARLLTAILLESFKEMPRIAEVLRSDAQTLQGLFDKRESERREFEREISYEGEVGTRARMSLKISPRGIEWQGLRWPLESITRLRWGGAVPRAGAPPEFMIFFGSGEKLARIDTYDQALWKDLKRKLWRAVGGRLCVEMLVELRKGGRLVLGNSVVRDHGIEFDRGSSGHWTCPWPMIRAEALNGSLVLCDQRLASARAELPYLAVDNVPILEFALAHLLEKRAILLSDILEK